MSARDVILGFVIVSLTMSGGWTQEAEEPERELPTHVVAIVRDRNSPYFDQVIERAPEFADVYIQHADYYIHVLTDFAASGVVEGIPEPELEVAAAVLMSDYDAAVQFARNERQRLNAIVDRAVISGEWRGLKDTLELALASPGCATPFWIDVIALPYGVSERSRDAISQRLECDPLLFAGRLHYLRMLGWLQENEKLIEAAATAAGMIDAALFRSFGVGAQIAQGNFDEADRLIENDLHEPWQNFVMQYWLAAAQSDEAKARTLMAEYRQRFGSTAAYSFYFDAYVGDRDAANRRAAETDARPFGHLVLAHSALTCFCGAPFDLDATPNFARLFSQSGFDWPPTEPVDWPLKTW